MAHADVRHVCSSSFDSQRSNAIFLFFFPLFLPFLLSFFLLFFFSAFISYCWLVPQPARNKVSIWWSREKSHESSTLVQGAGEERAGSPITTAPLARAFSRCSRTSLAIKPSFHMIVAIAEKKNSVTLAIIWKPGLNGELAGWLYSSPPEFCEVLRAKFFLFGNNSVRSDMDR